MRSPHPVFFSQRRSHRVFFDPGSITALKSVRSWGFSIKVTSSPFRFESGSKSVKFEIWGRRMTAIAGASDSPLDTASGFSMTTESSASMWKWSYHGTTPKTFYPVCSSIHCTPSLKRFISPRKRLMINPLIMFCCFFFKHDRVPTI